MITSTRYRARPVFRGRLAGATQVERVCKAILRTIWAQGLEPGDRLPNQGDLIASLGVSNNTVNAAMRRLVEAGVVVRRPRTGTIVVEPDAYSEPLWRVGVLENFHDMRTASPYWSLLGAFVQHDLANAGCWPRLYFHRIPHPPPPLKLHDFLSLREEVDQNRLDGAVCLGSLDLDEWHGVADGLPLCGFHERIPCGVLVDAATWRREARRMLAEAGCRSIADFENGDDQGCFPIRLENGGRLRVICPRPPGSPRAVYHMEVGRVAARTLLERPRAQRPDGLLVSDDYLAAGLTQTLRDHDGYRPVISVLTHQQNPLPYALPVLRFEVDISELSGRCVNLLLERLRDPSLPAKTEKIIPALASESVGWT